MTLGRWRKWGRWLAPVSLALAAGLVLKFLHQPAHAVPQGGYAAAGALIQAEELKALLDKKEPNLKIIDVRHKAKYYLGHIPGAIEVWRPEMEDKKRSLPGGMATQLQVENLLGRLGVGKKDTLVLYSDLYDHTRLWWLLAYYGFPLEQMKLLDGGIDAWKAKAYPTQLTSPHLRRTRFRFYPWEGRQFLLASLEEVKAAKGDPAKRVVDARTKKQYLGEEREEGAARAGHIPGAVWVEWKEARAPEGPDKGYWRPAAEIAKIYAAQGVTADKEVYLYSVAGPRASYSLVSLYLAGHPLEKLHLYAGSFQEWSRSQEPVETGREGKTVKAAPGGKEGQKP
jgi:thiosulfate/3-mercaptopyruvate sulfurtransferase